MWRATAMGAPHWLRPRIAGTVRRLPGVAAAFALAALLGIAGQARAGNECGPPEPGREVVCTPSTYNPAGGNIFYGHDETAGDFTLRLGGGLSIDYDRERPGDDVYVFPSDGESYYSAVRATPGEFGEYAGDVSLYSSADVTSNGVGILAGHYGKSGALRMEISGGEIATTGDVSIAIAGYRSEGSNGALDLIVRGVTAATAGESAHGIFARHQGEGDLKLDVRGVTVATAGESAHGILARHQGEGDLKLDVRAASITIRGGVTGGILGIHGGVGDANLAARDIAIDTAGYDADGVYGAHAGTGDFSLDVRDGSITTVGDTADGIVLWHQGAGGLNIDAQDLAIDTAGDDAYGISGWHQGEGELIVDAEGLSVDTAGVNADGVYGLHTRTGDVSLDVRGGSITTVGRASQGIVGSHRGEGGLNLDARDIAIDTAGVNGHGVLGDHRGEGELALTAQDLTIGTAGDHTYGVFAQHTGAGDLNLDVRGISVTTAGERGYGIAGLRVGEGELALTARDLTIGTAGEHAHGVFAQHQGAGDLNLDVRGISVTTTGTGASGIYGNHFAMDGDVVVRVRDGDVSTAGAEAFGVRGFHGGPGALDIDLRETTVATAGEGSYGIVIYRFGEGAARIAVDGGSVHAAGPGASGIQIGRLHEDGSLELASPVGEDGYRLQGVSVNAPVTGGSGAGAAGVFLAGGGRVAIGPRGRLGAASGVGIQASGGAPRLAVEIDLDGRRAGEVVDGAIRNDGGETTVAVNGVTLHDGAGGPTGARAANGAWDVSLSASETIAGRSFAPEDFIESYAPRAAVYEALPGFLLRLDGGQPSGTRIARPGSPAWARVSGGRGSYEPGRASVGAAYDFRRFSVEAGLEFALGGNVTGSFSLRHVQGSAEVDSPHGGGEIEAEGLGAAAGLAWSGADGYYARGRLAFTNYEIDVSSRDRGSLARDVEARGYSLGIEAGRRFAVGETVTLTPRAWAARRWLSGGAFTDAVGSRVSLDETTRYTGGIGLSAETSRTLEDGTLALRASADVERALGGADTAARVSGARLKSEASATRVLLGLGGTWRKGRFSLGARLAAGGPGSGDTEYSGRVSLGWTF